MLCMKESRLKNLINQTGFIQCPKSEKLNKTNHFNQKMLIGGKVKLAPSGITYKFIDLKRISMMIFAI